MEWSRAGSRLLAEVSTAIFDPPVVVAGLLVDVSIAASRRGLLRGVGAAIGAAIIPALYVLYGVEQHQVRDYTVPARENRPPVLFAATRSAFVTFVLFLVLHAPTDLLALLGTQTRGFAAAALTSPVWKVSLHPAALAGGIAIRVIAASPALAILASLLARVAWARLSLHARARA